MALPGSARCFASATRITDLRSLCRWAALNPGSKSLATTLGPKLIRFQELAAPFVRTLRRSFVGRPYEEPRRRASHVARVCKATATWLLSFFALPEPANP